MCSMRRNMWYPDEAEVIRMLRADMEKRRERRKWRIILLLAVLLLLLDAAFFVCYSWESGYDAAYWLNGFASLWGECKTWIGDMVSKLSAYIL